MQWICLCLNWKEPLVRSLLVSLSTGPSRRTVVQEIARLSHAPVEIGGHYRSTASCCTCSAWQPNHHLVLFLGRCSGRRRVTPVKLHACVLTKIEGYKHVRCFGLFGTYDNALDWLKSSQVKSKPKTILWLGSSLGNFKRHEVAPFLAGFRDAIQPGDSMVVGIDSCKDPDRVYHAYNDRHNVTHAFIMNGLKHANSLMQYEAFKIEDWEVIGEYDKEAGRHHAFVSPLKNVEVDGVQIAKGERVRIEESYKYSRDEILQLWEDARLVESVVWSNTDGKYGGSKIRSFLDLSLIHFRSPPGDKAIRILLLQPQDLRCQPCSVPRRVEAAMGGLGYCFT